MCSIRFFICVFIASHFILFAMWQPMNLRYNKQKNNRLFAQSFMKIVIIGWNAGKVTFSMSVHSLFFTLFMFFFDNLSLIDLHENIRWFNDSMQGKCNIYIYISYCVCLPVSNSMDIVKSLQMCVSFVLFFFAMSCGYRLSSNKWFDWNSLLQIYFVWIRYIKKKRINKMVQHDI